MLKNYPSRNKKRSCKYLFIIILLLIAPITFNFFTLNNNENIMNYDEIPFLKISGDNINITTPENKSYPGPMSGYYPATHGFENDEIGSHPNGWYVREGTSGTVEVISSLDDHEQVLQLRDYTAGWGYPSAEMYPDNVEFGTIELWMRNNDATYSNLVDVRQDSWEGPRILAVQISEDDFRYYDDSGWHLLGSSSSDDTWYHLRIDFELTDQGYLGMAENTFTFYIDGQQYGSYNITPDRSDVDCIRLATDAAISGYYCYYDAIGYSWDPNYDVGDNIKEGLLLSFENDTALEWMGYSLDGDPNITIQGNTTIPMPGVGTHWIQVSGNTSSGIYYQSDVRYFTMENGSIIIMTPEEDTTYYGPMSGYYPAIYSFDSPSEVSDFIFKGTDENQMTIDSEIDGHVNVLQLYDDSSSLSQGFLLPFGKDVGTGEIEFYFRTNYLTSEHHYMSFMDGDTSLFGFFCRGSGVFGYGAYPNIESFSQYSINTWYHLRISFDAVNDLFSIYINGNFVKTFDISPGFDTVNGFQIITGSTSTETAHYDAFGFSWDPNYDMGDNVNEGLLLSFENDSVLDWMGYSLDGDPNITVQGNTTIPMPSDGTHWIQVSGNSTSGLYYQSDLRYFSVNNGSITIITPEEDTTYYGPMSGYYPATYGFENDVGREPAGWTSTVTGDDTIEVIQNYKDHNSVVKIDHNSGTGALKNTFSSWSYGSIEFWICISDSSQNIQMNLIYNTEIYHMLFSLRINSGIIKYWDGSWHDILQTVSSDTWHHFRMDFESSSGGYQGLNQDSWQLFVDSNLIFTNKPFYYTGNPNNFYFDQLSADYCMIDAVGFTNDPQYNIGDNVNEGLLLSFETTTILDWMGYSLDGNPNITIQGNTTIPMPTGNGQHSIQVSGNNTWCMYCQSDIKNFTLDWEYIYLRPAFNQIDMINEMGLEFNITINAVGFLDIQRQSSIFPNLPHVDHDLLASYFYSIELLDAHFNEDPLILSSITIRFYYDPIVISNPRDLCLYHYISSEGRWREEDFIHNMAEHYVEFTTTELSYFCLAEPGGSIFPILPLIILVIVLIIIGISIPSAYVMFSKRKKKKEGSSKTIRTRKITIKRTEIIPLEERKEKDIREAPITPEMLTPIKNHRAKKKHEQEHPKKAVKFKEEEITIIDEEYEKRIVEETERTEREIIIEKESDFCIVHKGPITGINYVCPKCKAKYCMKCATTLKMKDENCWICDTPILIEVDKSKHLAIQDRKIELDDIIKSRNPIEELLKYDELEMTAISKEVKQKLDRLNLNEEELREILKDLTTFNAQEQLLIVNRMLEIKHKGTIDKKED